jgi:hypothetical protein
MRQLKAKILVLEDQEVLRREVKTRLNGGGRAVVFVLISLER